MKGGFTALLSALFLAISAVSEAKPTSRTPFNVQSVNLWHLDNLAQAEITALGDNDQKIFRVKKEEFAEQWFEQPLDHFSNDSHTFLQRYWVNDRHYKEGGPVIVLDGGETSGEDRIPFLDTGIVEILANATHGLGVVLEHRYYGKFTMQYSRIVSRSHFQAPAFLLLISQLTLCGTFIELSERYRTDESSQMAE